MEQNTINPIPFSLYLQRVQNKREKLSPLSKIRSPEKKEEDGGQRCSDAVVGLSAAASELFFIFFQIFFYIKRTVSSSSSQIEQHIFENTSQNSQIYILKSKKKVQTKNEDEKRSCYLFESVLNLEMLRSAFFRSSLFFVPICCCYWYEHGSDSVVWVTFGQFELVSEGL